MVWTDTILNNSTPFHVFESVTVTGARYRKAVLELHVYLFKSAVGPNYIIVDDIAWKHELSSYISRSQPYREV